MSHRRRSGGWARVAMGVALAQSVGIAGTPDLAIDAASMADSVSVELHTFAPSACVLQPADRCIRAPGARRLLRFGVQVMNLGTADLVAGNPLEELDTTLPSGDPKWVYSTCHDHFHLQEFARYTLHRRGETAPITSGEKRAFCIEDGIAVAATAPARFCCRDWCGQRQGLQVGWGDIYPASIDCQWIDITDGVPPGDYDLCVVINAAGVLADGVADNDRACVPLTLTPPTAPGPRVRVKTPGGRQASSRVGRTLRITWRRKTPGRLRSQEVWFSPDDGRTWTLLASDVPADRTRMRWTIPPDAATPVARVRVVVWTQNPPDAGEAFALQRAEAISRPFRVAPRGGESAQAGR